MISAFNFLFCADIYLQHIIFLSVIKRAINQRCLWRHSKKTGPPDLCPQRWLLGRHYRHVLLLQTKIIKLNAAEIREIKREREWPQRLLQTICVKLDKRNTVFPLLLSLTLLSICFGRNCCIIV